MRMKINKREFVRAKVNVSITPSEMLKTLRELQEITQAQLAEASGIPQSNLSALESGARQIGSERALTLARVLKVHPAVILFPDFDMRRVA